MKVTRPATAAMCSIMVVLVSISCSGQPEGFPVSYKSPTQSGSWTGISGGEGLADWGHAPDYIYSVLTDSTLVLRRWRGGSLAGIETVSLKPLGLSVARVPVKNSLFGVGVSISKPNESFVLVSLKDGSIQKQWSLPPGDFAVHAGASDQGDFVALGVGALRGKSIEDIQRLDIALIDVAKGDLKRVASLTGRGKNTVRELAVSPDGRYVAVGGYDNGVWLFDAESGEDLGWYMPKGSYLSGYVEFSPDASRLYAGGMDGEVFVLDVQTGSVLDSYCATLNNKREYGTRVSALDVDAQGARLAAGTGPFGLVYVWDLESPGKPTIFDHGQGSMCSIEIVAFSPRGGELVSVGGGEFKVWPVGRPKAVQESRDSEADSGDISE